MEWVNATLTHSVAEPRPLQQYYSTVQSREWEQHHSRHSRSEDASRKVSYPSGRRKGTSHEKRRSTLEEAAQHGQHFSPATQMTASATEILWTRSMHSPAGVLNQVVLHNVSALPILFRQSEPGRECHMASVEVALPDNKDLEISMVSFLNVVRCWTSGPSADIQRNYVGPLLLTTMSCWVAVPILVRVPIPVNCTHQLHSSRIIYPGSTL